MKMYGIDFAYNSANLNLTNCKQYGIKFVARYYSSISGKNLTPLEAKAYWNDGISIISVFEDGANNAYNGSAQATIDAQIALKCAQNVNQPIGSTIFFAVDANDSINQITNIKDYFSTLRTVMSGYKLGFYGSYATAEALGNLIDYTWCVQTWNGGAPNFTPDIIQMVENLPMQPNLGISYDLDVAQNLDATWNYPKTLGSYVIIDSMTIEPAQSTIIAAPPLSTISFISQQDNASMTCWVLNENNTNRSIQFTAMNYGKPYSITLLKGETAISVKNDSVIPIGVLIQNP